MPTDPYCYPGTNVLINQLNIQEYSLLQAAEARFVAFNLVILNEVATPHSLDEVRFRVIHRTMFRDIYRWAGQYREHVGRMSKFRDDGYEVVYGPSQHVPAEMRRIFRKLEEESYLRGLGANRFSEKLAWYLSQIDGTHPFRDGNSRTLRQFSSEIARGAGYRLDWSLTASTADSIRDVYLARDAASQRGELAPLIRLVKNILQSA